MVALRFESFAASKATAVAAGQTREPFGHAALSGERLREAAVRVGRYMFMCSVHRYEVTIETNTARTGIIRKEWVCVRRVHTATHTHTRSSVD
jgi:hypothetical protein